MRRSTVYIGSGAEAPSTMTRTAALFATLAVAVALLAVPVAGAVADDSVAAAQVDGPDANETAEPPAPGARLAGVVAVHGTEVESEVQNRAFGLRVAAATSNDTRADVVAERVRALRERTATLRERRQALLEARQNGTISQARYRAEMAALAARTTALGHQLDQTEAASRGVDTDRLAERGVDAEAIDALRTDARNLTGPEVADIARSIAGRDVGGGLADRDAPPTGRPDGETDDAVDVTLRTPTDDARPGNRTTTGDDRVRTDRPSTPEAPDTPERPEPGDRRDGTDALPSTEDPLSG